MNDSTRRKRRTKCEMCDLPQKQMTMRPAATALMLMLKDLMSDIQHSAYVENSEKWRLSAKISDIQIIAASAFRMPD